MPLIGQKSCPRVSLRFGRSTSSSPTIPRCLFASSPIPTAMDLRAITFASHSAEPKQSFAILRSLGSHQSASEQRAMGSPAPMSSPDGRQRLILSSQQGVR